jgi:hypothetical protein
MGQINANSKERDLCKDVLSEMLRCFPRLREQLKNYKPLKIGIDE